MELERVTVTSALSMYACACEGILTIEVMSARKWSSIWTS